MKILIADDQMVIRRHLEKALSDKGFEIETACDGKEALQKVSSSRPDLILLDVKMPEKDGFEVLEKIKSDQETAKIVVIMLTGASSPEDIARGNKLGADKYLTKPIKIGSLIEIIERYQQDTAD